MSRQEAHLEPGLSVELTHLRTQRRVRCTVGERLGEGGTAWVYSATLEDGACAVLKVQRWAGEVDPAFQLELELFHKLAHRNVVHCVGSGRAEGLLILAFRRAYSNPLLLMTEAAVARGMLRDRKARYPSLPIDTAIDLGYELINALAYVEKLGLVHHDVKLANLLIDPGPRDRPLKPSEVFGVVVRRAYRAVLIDFGATRSREYLDAWNRGVAPPGPVPQITPFYAPPEAVVETRRADGELRYLFHPSLDVYATALILYAMVTGHPPYNHLRETPRPDDLEAIVGVKSQERRGEVEPISLETIQRAVFEDTRFVSGDRAAFDMAFYRFLARRLDADPDKRGTAAEMKQEFERLARIERASAKETGKLDVREGSRVALPFTQGLVEVASRTDHPLLRAARLYGQADDDTPARRPQPRPRSGRSPRPGARTPPPGGSTPVPAGGAPLPAPRVTRRVSREAPAKRTSPKPKPAAAGRAAAVGAAEQRRQERAPLAARGYPAPGRAQAPHCLVSPVLDQPFLLDRQRGRMTIGRAAEADVRIQSDRVSRQHAEIRWDGKAFVLRDLDSTNGTTINGASFTGACPLHHNDRISVGGFEVEVRVLRGGEPASLADEQGETRAYTGGAPDLSRLETPALAGTLGQLSIKDVMELLEWKRHSGTLTLEPPELPPGYLYFREGRIHHAKAGRLEGKEAALALLRLRRARFSFAHGKTAAPVSIEQDNDALWQLASTSGRS